MRNQRSVRSLLAAVAAVTVAAATAHAQTPPQYEIKLLGPVGADYVWSNYDGNGGVYRESAVSHFNVLGNAAGTTNRYSGSGTGALPAGSDAWLWNGTATQQLGFTGTGYEHLLSVGSVANRLSVVNGLNDLGQAIGVSYRYSPTGVSLGSDGWVWDGSEHQQVGLTSVDYQKLTPDGVSRSTTVSLLSSPKDAGDPELPGDLDDTQVAGTSQRYSTSGDSAGIDAWVWSGGTTQQAGLFGTSEYQYTMAGGGGTSRSSTVNFLNDAGYLAGTSKRYLSNGTDAGTDVWVFNSGSNTRLGLLGTAYQKTVGTSPTTGAYRSSEINALNASGQVAGRTRRFSSSGQDFGFDAWVWTPGGTEAPVGLVDTLHQWTSAAGTQRSSTIRFLTDSGVAAGTSVRYGSNGSSVLELGKDVWVWDGNLTREIGLTGAEYEATYPGTAYKTRDATLRFVNDEGQAAGTNLRYQSISLGLGQDAWVFDGTTTHRVGLTGGAYEFLNNGSPSRSSAVVAFNQEGQAAGTSARYAGTNAVVGTGAWVWTGTQTVETGLTGGDYHTNSVLFLNALGQAAGTTTRRSATTPPTSLGTDAWFFDEETGTSTLRFSSRPSDNYSYTSIGFLTDTGVVLGSYELFEGETSRGNRAFWWSKPAGFFDLGMQLVDGGLSASEWRYLADVYGTTLPGAAGTVLDGAPQYIVGTGLAAGQTAGQVAFVMTAIVPEPTTAAVLLAPAALGLLARRRRA